MKTEFRNRAFLPVVMPLAIVGVIAVCVGLFAWILLYNTKQGSLALAAVMATGILVSIALAASADELDARRRAGAIVAIGIPILLGVVLAGTGGGVEDEALLNINREEISVVPEVNVHVEAVNSNEFVQTQVTLPSDVTSAIIFDNEEVGVPHNVAVTLAGEGGTAPASLEPIVASPINTGPDSSFVTIEGFDPGTYWYWCQVHPNMNGVLTLAEGAEPSAA